jgi:type II secretory pathway pseudopilin PulG
MPNKKYFKKRRGFGILEVLISSAIIIMVLGTLVTIARSSLINSQYMQERSQAVSLAAEGIETVLQNRDSNYIDGNPSTQWNMVGSASTAPVSDYYDYTFYIPFDLINNRLRLNTSVPAAIIIDGVNYTRKIYFINIANMTTSELLTLPTNYSNSGANGFIAKVEVTWAGSGGKSGKVELRELITNNRFVY